MKKINAYENTLAEIEALKKKLEALENDDELKKSLEFKKQLEELMKTYNVSSDELLNLLGPDKAPSKASASDKRRGARPLKVYKNPQTGEVVETRGGNHKVLNAWKEQYGKETVESWLAA